VSRLLLLIIVQSFLVEIISAQVNIDSLTSQKTEKDSLISKDSLPSLHRDNILSLSQSPDTGQKTNPTFQQIKQQISQENPYIGFKSGSSNKNPLADIKKFDGKEPLFYVLTGLFICFAFLRRAFPKYFNDLFRLFFRTTIKQRQITEQLMQTPLPSVLMNGFFVISSGLYIDLLLFHFALKAGVDFWLWFMYCTIGISVIYSVKFIGLKLTGWVLNLSEASNSYIFVVFVVNKIIGLFLLPFLVLLAFLNGPVYDFILIFSFIGIGILLVYRLILTYNVVRNQVKVNPFHFFLYFCGFEIAPLLLIYKALLVLFK
jgi:hypothetical protein